MRESFGDEKCGLASLFLYQRSAVPIGIRYSIEETERLGLYASAWK